MARFGRRIWALIMFDRKQLAVSRRRRAEMLDYHWYRDTVFVIRRDKKDAVRASSDTAQQEMRLIHELSVLLYEVSYSETRHRGGYYSFKLKSRWPFIWRTVSQAACRETMLRNVLPRISVRSDEVVGKLVPAAKADESAPMAVSVELVTLADEISTASLAADENDIGAQSSVDAEVAAFAVDEPEEVPTPTAPEEEPVPEMADEEVAMATD